MANSTVYPYGTNGELPSSIGLINDLITGGVDKALTAQQGVIIGQRLAKVEAYEASANNLHDAIAEFDEPSMMVPGARLNFYDSTGTLRHYKYMGKFYTELDWLSETSWLDLDYADEYVVRYFMLCPDFSKSTPNSSFDSTGEITSGSWNITDYLPITENGLLVGGENLAHYVLYDANKDKIGTRATLYKAKTFQPADGAFVRIEYKDSAPLTWKLGYISGGAARVHVEVERKYDDPVNYDEIDYVNLTSGFIPVKAGETIYIHTVESDEPDSTRKMSFQRYDENKEYINTESGVTYLVVNSQTKFIKIGASAKSFITYYQNGFRYSKSAAKTYGYYHWLALGDSNTDFQKASDNYVRLIAKDRKIAANNRAASGATSSNVLSTLSGIDISPYDVITILVGGNDFGYNAGATVLKGNLQSMIDYIIDNKPTCKIGLFTMFNRYGITDDTYDAGHVSTRGQYEQAIREVGYENGIPVLDLQHDCQCDLRKDTYNENYSINADGRHLTNEAHKLFVYPLVKQFIEKLLG